MSDKKYLVIERQKYSNIKDSWSIKFADVDEDTAFTKMVALRTLNEDKDKLFGLQEAIRNKIALETLNTPDTKTSYHLQEVKFSEVQEPLILTKDMEVKEDNQEEMPF